MLSIVIDIEIDYYVKYDSYGNWEEQQEVMYKYQPKKKEHMRKK